LLSVLLLLFAALEGLSGCGFTSASTTSPKLPSGTLSLNPSSLSFGNVAIGATSTQSLALENTGNGSLTISQAVLTNNSFSVPGLQLPLAIPAGKNVVVQVQCDPQSSGSANATLTLSSDASDPSLSLPLSAVGVQGQLAATPSSVNFGSVTVGSTASQTITLTNSGTASTTVTQAAVSGAGYTLSGPTLPLTLAPGQNASYTATFTPAAAGNATGNISIASNAANSPLSIPLSGTGTQAALAVAPSSLSFGNVAVGGKATETLTLTDTGNAALVLTAANISGAGYSLSGASLPLTLGAGQSGTLNVQFSPLAAGSENGSVSLVSNAPGSPLSVSLSGSGVAQSAVLTVSPTSLNFGTVLTGSSSSQTITLSNTGTTSFTISQISTSGSGFSASGLSPPLALAGGQTAQVTITFAPTAAGSASGTVTITSTASNPSVTVGVTGTASTPQPQITVSPTSVNFGNVDVGQSNSQSITVSNPGNAALNITQATVSGTAFSLSGLTLPLAINPGQSAVWTASFSPASATSFTGSISITSNAASSPATVAVSGTGVQGLLGTSPSSLSFGNVLVGSSGSQTVTLTNSGSASLTVTQANVSGAGYSLSGLSLPLTLSVGQNASFSVGFAPTAAGSATGSVSLTSNASNPNLSIGLAGTGTEPQLSANPTSVSFGSLPVGSTNSQSIVLNNPGTATVTLSQATVSGSGFGMSGLNVPLTIAAGANATFTATYTPTTAGSASGSITLTSNAPGSPLTIALAGTGLTATYLLNASPTSLSFGNVILGGNSSLGVTLTNGGNSNITISAVTASDPSYTTSGVAAGVILAPGQSATLSVSFSPTTAGTISGTLTVTSNATNSPLTISLSGTGVQQHSVALNWNPSTSSVVGYFIYRSSVSGGPYTKLNSTPNSTTSYTDATVVSGQTYYYVVTAVDSSNVESSYSNEVAVSVP
jgi:hypothetical protein